MSLNGPQRVIAVFACAILCVSASHAVTGEEKAWAMFENAAKSNSTSERAIGVRALGLLRNDARARTLAESALEDTQPDVRVAAATALGQMRATESIPKLQKLLSDGKLPVVMAAAHSLRDLKDNTSAYAVYYDILTGGRKSDGVMVQQLDTLKNPKEMAKIGIEQGMGFVPFAGIGWEAWRYMHKKDPNPVRAVAATFLAHDPDPATGAALVEATKDRDWIVRAAAIEAIAQRGDPSLEAKIEFSFFDANLHVRYTAAAAVIRLTSEGRRLARKESGKASAKAGQEAAQK